MAYCIITSLHLEENKSSPQSGSKKVPRQLKEIKNKKEKYKGKKERKKNRETLQIQSKDSKKSK